jgi:hypothetical protein
MGRIRALTDGNSVTEQPGLLNHSKEVVLGEHPVKLLRGELAFALLEGHLIPLLIWIDRMDTKESRPNFWPADLWHRCERGAEVSPSVTTRSRCN